MAFIHNLHKYNNTHNLSEINYKSDTLIIELVISN